MLAIPIIMEAVEIENIIVTNQTFVFYAYALIANSIYSSRTIV